ncbi:MAG: cupin domain-containing protein [Cyanosarcina radialis HA8281-LM2]|jgi:mannose-6-phosphate isomerase-like protein (cupin superfamily)|nr:cupin domain-containing protein [Cyanosarcina radialis HA8281-LM2]
MGISRFWVRSIPNLTAEEQTSDWTIKTLFKDYPGIMGKISAYYSVLRSGSIPHEIHSHHEEEIMVLLSGHLDIISPANRLRVGPGSFFHHPPGDWHTIQSVGVESAAFLVFKWTWETTEQTEEKANFFCFHADRLAPWDDRQNIQFQQVCSSQPLANGGRLAVNFCHFLPESGYPAHKHEHDLIVVLLNGELHGMGHTNSAPALIYYPAGTIHGMSPHNRDEVNMLEFQFHGSPTRDF